ncbi:MAG: hypothetical protein RLZZ210_554 [Pseudomonadota bacterium]|jgi:uncharacterized protein
MVEIDLFKIINSQESYEREFKAIDLTRITQTEAEHKSVKLKLDGELQDKSGKKIRLLHVKINGEINLVCQRCNTGLQHKIDIMNTVDVFPTKEMLDSTPIEDESYDTIVGSSSFDIQELLEEEILLSLPAFPMHDECPNHEYIAKEDKPKSPFAILEQLKKN